MADQIDIFTLLQIPRNSGKSLVKNKYKQMVAKYHPDKPEGDIYKFRLLNRCYKEYIKNLPEEKTHDDLRKNANQFYRNEGTGSARPNLATNKSFNVNRFNQMFEENHLKDENFSKGYANLDDELDDEHVNEFNTEHLLRDGCGKDKFNEEFERARKRQHQFTERKMREDPNSSYNKQVAQYYEPSELMATTMGYSLLGEGEVNDFTNDDPYSGGTKYTDYRRAFYQDNILIDPSSVERKEYSMREYEAARDMATTQPITDWESQRREAHQMYLKEQEQQRVDNLKRQEQLYNAHEAKVKQMFLEQ